MAHSRISHKLRLIAAAAAAVVLLFGGCSNDSPTRPTADEGTYRIQTFQLEEPTLVAGDSTTVSARVLSREGDPASGVPIVFGEMLGKRSGSWAPDRAVTGADGWAHTTFRTEVGTDGQTTLKVTAGTVSAYALLTLVPRASNALNLAISSPSSAAALAADGVSGLALRVTATRGAGSGVASGLAVSLTAGDRFIDNDGDGVFGVGDQLMPGGDANGNGSWDPLGSVPSSVTTDPTGHADFVLRSESKTGTTYVRATAERVTAEYAVQLHPTSLKVVVAPAASELMADGISTTEVQAEVTDWAGNPMPGVIVRFIAGEPFMDVGGDGEFTTDIDTYTDTNGNGRWDTRGTIDSYVLAGSDGSATATYRAGVEPGEVRIRATVTGGSAEGTLNLVNVPSASRLHLESDLTEVLADGRSPVTVTVVATDVNGTPIAGKRVHFVAGEPFDDVNHNGVFDAGTDQLQSDLDGNHVWSAVGAIDESVVTGEGGAASITYTAGLLTGQIAVKATVDRVSADLPILLRSLPPAMTVTLERTPPEIQVHGGGGVDNCVLVATCYDALGDAVPAGVPVEFSIIYGPEGGEALTDAVDGIYGARTDEGGQARAVLLAGAKVGIVGVAVQVGQAYRSVEIAVAAGGPHEIQLNADNTRLDFWSDTAVTAYVVDLYGNPVRDNTVILWSVDEGMIEGDGSAASSETHRGQAQGTYHSLGPSIGTDYKAEITARAQGTTALGTLEIALNLTPPPPIAAIQISADRQRIDVQSTGPAESSDIIARGYDTEGNPVGSGYPIDFWIESGPNGGENIDEQGWGPVTGLTNQDGIAQVILYSGRMPGPVQVKAHGGTANFATAEVQIVAGPPTDIVCSATPGEIGSEETCEIRAYVYDLYHNPVQDGVLVSFQVDEGMVVGRDGPGSSRTTDGMAVATYHSLTPDPRGDGWAVIDAAVLDGPSCQTRVSIPIWQTEIVSVSLRSLDSEIAVRGTGAKDQTTVIATPMNAQGNPVGSGTSVLFTVTSGPGGGEMIDGQTQAVSAVTRIDGTARITLTAGTRSGLVSIEARAGSEVADHWPIVIAAGPPAFIECAAPDSAACGDFFNVSDGSVRAHVTDTYHNPVRDGTTVWFSADRGLIYGTDGQGSSMTVSGVAVASYYAPLASECAAWSVATLTFRVADLVCTRTVTKIAFP